MVLGVAVNATSAGPGHSPTSPQPRPNRIGPMTRGVSISVRVGSENVAAKRGEFCFKINRKPTNVTATAPAITKAKDGSHCPKTSRNPITLPGLIMPETISPKPNKSPLRNMMSSLIRLSPNDAAHKPHGNNGCEHEDNGCNKRPGRKARESTYTMARRTSIP